MEGQDTALDKAWILKEPYLDAERDVLEFIELIRSERLPVTLSLIQTRVILSAKLHQNNDFKAFRGWVAKLAAISIIKQVKKI